MELKLYNTLSAQKEIFTPLKSDNVRMYVCGPTVYDHAHIGNARPIIVFDVLYRLLRHVYGETHVTYARNITDVDDKINARAAEEGVPISEITSRTTKQFHEDIAALGVLPPDVEPRATGHIEQMKALIEKLVEKGNAYVAEGHVLFDVPSMPDYGKLSKRPLDEMEAGARVEVAPYKKDPMDFVLWKPSKESEPAWDSPCGIEQQGRPGWHIECSAMSAQHLGETFDIHGGGVDLVFPHHENEIAQSRCGFGTDMMAQVWMHNGYLQVEGEKMSKSAGNFITIHDLLHGINRHPWPGEVIRLTMLATHYRQPIDFSEAKLNYWRQKLSHWVACFKLFGSQEFDFALYTGEAELNPSEQLVSSLCDDLNTHKGISFFDELSRRAIKQDSKSADELGRNLIWMGLMRNSYAAAYETHLEGGARPDLLQKYSEEIWDARAIVLNEYNMSADVDERAASLEAVNNHIKHLNPQMISDGVEIEVSEHAVVRLEPKRSDAAINEQDINRLVEARNAARDSKDFAEADRIRDELAAMGVALKDGPEGTTWEIAR